MPVELTTRSAQPWVPRLEARAVAGERRGVRNTGDVVETPEEPVSNHRLHRVINATLAAVALVILFPIGLVVAIAIKLDSRGPVFYRQLRIGLDRRGGLGAAALAHGRRTADLGGLPFTIYKFRTMHLDAEDRTGPVWATREDARITRVGRFLRPYRLDEIPQFWNVLRGEMSVVGPRPERPSFVHVLRNELEEYPLRQRVPPGITGWAQVNQEPDQTMDDVRQKLEYDLEYLRRRSLSFDLRIMLRTVPVMLERWSSRE
jgi:lipopolysaccharide/colanic/teichoic acid biosynthesis glycosyltransferase